MPCLGLLPIRQRMVQAVPQPARAHAGGAAVEQGEQGGLGFAGDGLADFEIAARGWVEAQVFVVAFDLEGGNVGQRLQLRGARVFEQGTGGGERRRGGFNSKSGEVPRGEVLRQGALCRFGVEMPVGQAADGGRLDVECVEYCGIAAIGEQYLGRIEALQMHGQRGGRRIEQAQVAIGEVEPGEAGILFVDEQRKQQAVALVVKQRGIGERAGRDDACDSALDRALARGRRGVSNLFADRHRNAELDQLGQVLFGRVVRHAAHRYRLAVGSAA